MLGEVVTTASATSAAPTPEARARALVELLAKDAFDEAVAGFDETMAKSLPAPKLREMWVQLGQGVGAFRKCGAASSERAGAYEVIVLACEFEKSSLRMKTAWDSRGRLAGLFLLPPEEPYAPPPYAAADLVRRDVTVGSAPWSLPGELVLPRGTGPFPAVVLVHGSGPGDRNEAVGSNHPFEDLALGLASKGVAVIRYDKRTNVHAKEIAADPRAFTVEQETVEDAVLAAKLLAGMKEIDPKRIYILGHSLGGQLAPRIVEADPSIAGMIIMAGSTRPIGDMMIEQMEYIFAAHPSRSKEEQAQLDSTIKANERLKQIVAGAAADPREMVLGAPPAYWLDLAKYDALAVAGRLDKPTLVLQGERDYQVTIVDFEAWKKALAKSKRAKLKLYPALNHLMIPGGGASMPEEYDVPGHVDEAIVSDIAAWIGHPER
jgi:dienelactone hydrolase